MVYFKKKEKEMEYIREKFGDIEDWRHQSYVEAFPFSRTTKSIKNRNKTQAYAELRGKTKSAEDKRDSKH